MTGFFQIGDCIHSVWSPPHIQSDGSGATVGYDGVTKIVVDKADGPMGHYAVAVVWRDDAIWQVLPLHMMESIEVSPGNTQ